MTLEELEARIEQLESEKDKLANNNNSLTRELKEARAKIKDIDPESHYKILDENESLKSELAKTKKLYDTDTKKLSDELVAKEGFINKSVLEDGLSKALLESGVNKDLIPAALAMLKNEAKVNKIDDNYVALIGDKQVNEFVPDWVANGYGKHFVTATPDVGGGAGGGNANSSNNSSGKLNGTKAEQEAYIKAKFNL